MSATRFAHRVTSDPNFRIWLTAAAAVAVSILVLLAPRAAADGLPVANLDTTDTGISARDGSAHFYALARRGETEVLKVTAADGSGRDRSLERTSLDGILAVPGVAFDGTTSGMAADGASLALIEPRISFPRRETRLVVLDTEKLKRISTIDLDGDFSFDAISPDGSLIYLIHYLSPRDPTKYEVRAYDVTSESLRKEPIIDSRTAPVVMRGFPITRETSPDGAWAYTLYDGAGETPFVHALNTADGKALCIDLDMLAAGPGGPFPSLFKVTLEPAPDGGSIAVRDRGGAELATISTDDWVAVAPEPADADAGGDDAAVWIAIPLIVLGLLMIGWGLRRRMQQGRAASRAATG